MATQQNTKAGRFYKLEDGTRLPSVTTILQSVGKPQLIAWAAKEERTMVIAEAGKLHGELQKPVSPLAFAGMLESRLGVEKAHSKILTKAGDIGTEIHKLVDWTLRSQLVSGVGPRPTVSDTANIAFGAFEKWMGEVKLKPILIEQKIWSTTYGYAGTMDLFAEVNGELALVDFKSGKAVYGEAHLQVAAYMHALREMGHGEPAKGYIVRLPKNVADPQAEMVEADPFLDSFSTFLAVKRLWEWQFAKEEKRQAGIEKANPLPPDLWLHAAPVSGGGK